MPELSVIIPFKDEEEVIESTVTDVLVFLKKNYSDSELILVDDGGRDKNVERLNHFLGERVRLIRHETNLGKGAAVRTGVLHANGDFVLFSDADLATPIAEINPLLKALKDDVCDVAIASRAVPGSNVIKQQAWPRVLIGKAGNVFIRAWLGLQIKDTQCGFKAFKRETAKNLFQEQLFPGWSFDIEILYRAKLRNVRVKELPVRWIDSDKSHVRPITDAPQVLVDVVKMKKLIRKS